VLGGEMGAYDDPAHPWLRATKRLLCEAVETGVPVLGICLGHQLLAVANGGRVEPHPTGRQRGLYPMDWTDAAVDDALFGPLVRAGGYDEPVAVQWNVDVVAELPAGAQALARSADGVLQAMRVGQSAWGIQAHPEAGVGVVGTWSLDASDQPLVAALGPAEPRLRACWRPLADGFAARCGARAPVPAVDRTLRPPGPAADRAGWSGSAWMTKSLRGTWTPSPSPQTCGTRCWSRWRPRRTQTPRWPVSPAWLKRR